VSAPAPIAVARLTSPRNRRDRVAAVRRIQKIIAVTQPTARMLSEPPIASCALADKVLVVNVRTAAKLPATATAASTPSQIGAELFGALLT
jgi:hypothetical protein